MRLQNMLMNCMQEFMLAVMALRAIGLRYFIVFGKRQDPNGAYAAVIPKWIAGMIQGEMFLSMAMAKRVAISALLKIHCK